MQVSTIIAQIDEQISKLQQARALLSTDASAIASPAKRRGRPKGSKNTAPMKSASVKSERSQKLADAMKRRWAAKRAAKKSA